MLLLRIDVDPYEYMDKWGDFNETSLPQKENALQQLKYERY